VEGVSAAADPISEVTASLAPAGMVVSPSLAVVASLDTVHSAASSTPLWLSTKYSVIPLPPSKPIPFPHAPSPTRPANKAARGVPRPDAGPGIHVSGAFSRTRQCGACLLCGAARVLR